MAETKRAPRRALCGWSSEGRDQRPRGAPGRHARSALARVRVKNFRSGIRFMGRILDLPIWRASEYCTRIWNDEPQGRATPWVAATQANRRLTCSRAAGEHHPRSPHAALRSTPSPSGTLPGRCAACAARHESALRSSCRLLAISPHGTWRLMPFRRRLLGEVWLGQTSPRRKDVAKAPPQSLPADHSLGRRNSAKIRATTRLSSRCRSGSAHKAPSTCLGDQAHPMISYATCASSRRSIPRNKRPDFEYPRPDTDIDQSHSHLHHRTGICPREPKQLPLQPA